MKNYIKIIVEPQWVPTKSKVSMLSCPDNVYILCRVIEFANHGTKLYPKCDKVFLSYAFNVSEINSGEKDDIFVSQAGVFQEIDDTEELVVYVLADEAEEFIKELNLRMNAASERDNSDSLRDLIANATIFDIEDEEKEPVTKRLKIVS